MSQQEFSANSTPSPENDSVIMVPVDGKNTSPSVVMPVSPMMTGREHIDWLNKTSKQTRRTSLSESLKLAEDAIAKSEALGYKGGIAAGLANTAACYYNLTNFEKALHDAYRAVQLFADLSDDFGQAVVWQVIGCVYLALGENEKARDYFSQSVPVFEIHDDPFAYSSALMNLGSANFHLKKHKLSIESFFKALQMREAIGDKSGMSEVISNIGAIYVALHDYETALSWIERALTLARASGYKAVEISILMNLSEIYEKINNTDMALLLLKEAETLSEQAESKNLLHHISYSLAKLHRQMENYKEATQYYEKYIALRDKIMGAEVERKIKSIELANAVENTRRSIEIAQANARIKQLEEIVTVCAWSGKIQLNGKWVKIEDFLKARFGMQVSHGISDEEARKYLGDNENSPPEA
jgi:tetratricopeptide (TPR) repeat protein